MKRRITIDDTDLIVMSIYSGVCCKQLKDLIESTHDEALIDNYIRILQNASAIDNFINEELGANKILGKSK